ncbi:programmed cell death protein 11 pre-rrna processing protein rrp5 [Holotrichia oblita]|uniref:Programmed cell death protein 11 pre-rrna processing protein rrp5 n=1 Tax=Holotrichia oblita TaxID=644536 RepID=A0ACB9THU9_HOLOL|nr:programmed cell death protein 11 pre-rrna processing protein rrp5 [Holotrichia oblita]
MDKMYICTFERNALKEEIFTKDDLKVAQAVSGVIEEINASGIVVKIGKVTAFATNEHLSNSQYSDNIKRNYRVGNRINARVWNIDENGVKLTLKPDFLPDGKYLTNNEMAKRNDEYKGMVIKTYKKGALISFFGGVKGWLKCSGSSKNYTDMFYPGEIIKVTITHNNGSRLFVSLDPPEVLNTRKLQVGQYTSGTVELIKSDGIFIRTEFANFQGFLPTSQISINYKLSNVMLNLFNVGEKIDRLMCIEKDKRRTLSLREYTYYHDDKFYVPKRSQLKSGMVLRCSIKSYDKKQLLLTSPILFFNNTIRVYKEDILDDGSSPDDIDFVKGQAVVAKLTVINENQLISSVRLSDVFDYDFEYPVDLLRKYLNEVDKIQKKFLLKDESIARYSIGQRVRCQIKKINNVGCSVIVDDAVQGIVAAQHWPNKPLIGSTHEGVILYVNFVDNYLEISLNNLTNQKINKMQGNTTGIQIGQILYAKTLLIRPEFVLCSLGPQGNKQIGFMPVALHENDFKPCYDYYRDLTGTFKFIVTSIANDKIIGLEKGLKLSLENKNKSNLKNIFKRKLSKTESDDFESSPKKIRPSSPEEEEKPDINMEETDIASSENNSDVKEELSEPSPESSSDDDEDQDRDDDESGSSSSDSEDEEMVSVDKKENGREEDDGDSSESERSSDSTGENVRPINGSVEFNSSEKHTGTEKRRVSFSEVIQKFPITDSDGSPRSTAKFTPPSVQNYFDSDKEEASESSSDEDDADNTKPKKKKLSRAEQAEILKQQEDELRRKEIEFAEASGVPQSAEQFDRRLLAEPNSSELWTQYISFHLASTEVDKARAVVRRALQTIDIKAEQDRLNVWIASMNLENYYGTKETFTKVFEEAVRCNDDFTIYMQTIKILASTNNSSVEDYIKKARAKFKQNPKMYIEIGRIYYLQKRYEEARKLKDIALMTIKNTAETVPLIVKFAIMEFDYGEEYQAEALFETILQSTPKRVDVWSTYVDQLMKRDKIDIARRVLERAVTQQLNLKKMKMLHKKYHAFEKIFGNEETQAQQKRLLEAYMKQFENVQE